MTDGAWVAIYVLSCMGITVLTVWPAEGLVAHVRDRMLRPLLPKTVAGVLDCYICCGTWVGILCAPGWWWAGCHCSVIAWPIVPLGFWLVLRESDRSQ